MNKRLAHDQTFPSPTETLTALPRTWVNSSSTAPYVPSKAVPLRAGAEDHKRQQSRGQPT